MSPPGTYKGWLWAIFMGFDQLGNAIAGGHPDVSVSARLGYLTTERRDSEWFDAVADLVDWAFWPVDGPLHCYYAWQALKIENMAEKARRGNDVGLVILTLFVLVFIVPLWAVNWLRRWVRCSRLSRGR